MLVDLNKTPTPSPFNDTYDLCVCGSGPAGVTVARKAAAGGARVLLLEAGGFEPTAASMAVYQGRNIGREYYGIESGRLRYFGGTSGHWAGICGLFDPIDFEERQGRAAPSWPITRNETYAHRAEAAEILDIPGADFQEEPVAPELAAGYRAYAHHRSAPTRFGEKYRRELTAHRAVDVALNANVVGLSLDENGARVTGLEIANYDGARFNFSAHAYVLAFGAIETPRFLLIADRQNNGALSAKTDFIGRCFMEHFSLALARFAALKPEFWDARPRLTIKPHESDLRRSGLGNAVLTLNANAAPRDYGRLAPLRSAAREFFCSTEPLARAGRRVADFTCPGDGIVTTIMEQSPNPLSRVLLDDRETDQFESPRLALDWRITDTDRETILTLTTNLGKTLARAGIGRVRIFDDVLSHEADLGLHSHQMGTTRMSASPRDGVVDRNCKVHGVDNLFIAGASVFPTGGGSNPTFTVVSLALRLGAHLAEHVLKRP
ncbi:MAG: GMC family oxidoreductase [Pseudomonadota bacterium]